ncbi:hypothetical protein, partial [Bradyrhizobium liaoningense]|uniref:hypothetical protein n=1 Tax=Bradyrhizobium liaoningense TaxID=43992 RepID=UPI0039089948
RSKNPRRCQAENPLKLLSEFAGPALSIGYTLILPWRFERFCQQAGANQRAERRSKAAAKRS